MSHTKFTNDFSQEIWATTYKYHTDHTVDDSIKRVAKAIASVEKTQDLKDEWEHKFTDMLSDFKVTTGGRILSNAGTDYKGTSSINCFVGTKPDYDQDSLDGILEVLRAQAQTLKSEGGWGMNFSFIRPRGALIKGIGSETPGAVKYMELFDKSSDIITAGSGRKSLNKEVKGKIRKGAQMGVLYCWHPDVEEFIQAKQTSGRLDKFNISVGCTNEFMDFVLALKEEQKRGSSAEHISIFDKWNLEFPQTDFESYKSEWDGDLELWKSKGYPVVVYKTISALGLWDMIIKSTYNRNDPGVLFLDIANKTHCWNYGGSKSRIHATNPCFHGDTLIAVADGRNAVTIKQLAEEGADIPVYTVNPNDGKVEIKWGRNPRITGVEQELLRIKFDNKSFIEVTPNHKFLLMDGRIKEAKDLVSGDSIPNFAKYKDTISNKNDKEYFRVHCDIYDYTKNQKFEHRLVCKFFNTTQWDSLYDDLKRDGWIKGGIVVHHKDYNGLNNNIDNLQLMSFRDHNEYHAKNDFKGKKNPMFGKFHSDETKAKIGLKTVERNKNKDFKIKIGQAIKESFTQERKDYISDVRTNYELNRRIELAKNTGLDAFVVDGEIFVNKICEYTGTSFVVPWSSRQISLNPNINPMYIDSLRDKCKENRRLFLENKYRNTLHSQIMIYKDLQESLGREPFKKEWESECKKKGVVIRFDANTNNPFTLPGYKALKEKACTYNHRVSSIEKVDGLHTVYNITTDDNHTVGIINKITDARFSGIFTLQCGEQNLIFSGCCNLASMNLTQFLNEDLTDFDYKKVEKYSSYLTRFSDNVNDYSFTPLPEYDFSLKNYRRIGLGILGWASSLYLLKIRFASNEAEVIKNKLMKCFTTSVIKTSIDLAKEKGAFTACDNVKHADAYFWKQISLEKQYTDSIEKYGIRNSALFSIQPTGNTSILANIVSGGLEPIFLPEYIRTVIVSNCPDELKTIVPKYWTGDYKPNEHFISHKEGNDDILKYTHSDGTVYKIDKNRGLTKEVLCEDYAVSILKQKNEWDSKADWAVTALSLSVNEHISDMAGWGKWVDSSISKTVNLPNDYPFDKFEDLYLNAYKTGYLKGITTYRAGTMTTVLSAKEDLATKPCMFCKRPKGLDCDVYHVYVRGKDYFVLVGLKDGNPYEVFAGENGVIPKNIEHGVLKRLKRGHYNLMNTQKDTVILENIVSFLSDDGEALTRMVSMSLRSQTDANGLNYVVQQLEKVEGGLTSLSKAMARCLKKYIKDDVKVTGEACPNCNKETLVRSEGCKRCLSCGSSLCG